ncbi:MAG: dienelactone hydrolase family protein [Verrucomicrobiota bacterium]
MKKQSLAALWLLCVPGLAVAEHAYTLQEVVYAKDLGLKGYLAYPKGEGPFPVVVYHHGGLGKRMGGDPRGTSIALAKAGYVGFSPLRRKTEPMKDAIEDAGRAMAYLRSLPRVDPDRLGLLGFSRGGYITFYSAVDHAQPKAMVIMACAPGRRNQEAFLGKVRDTRAPVLLLVAENDHKRSDLVGWSRKIGKVLDAAGREPKLIVYPPYQDDGHRMFFELGAYWKEVIAFLDEQIGTGPKPDGADRK